MKDLDLDLCAYKALNPVQDSDQSALLLASLIITMRTKRILELGTRDGDSGLYLLIGASYVDGHVTSVDINQTTFVPPKELAPYWTFIKSEAVEYLTNLPKDTKFDLIFVDDWHSESQVSKELELCKDLIEDENSLILLHDTMFGDHQPHYRTVSSYKEFEGGGPYQAVCNFVKENSNFEFATIPSQHGMTILRRVYEHKNI
jgi:predicted O-methyltransferase YrrM